MAKEYRLEDDLMRKSRPKWKSKRYARLQAALWASDLPIKGFAECEICGTTLLNPQSILLHQGRHCQKQLSKNENS